MRSVADGVLASVIVLLSGCGGGPSSPSGVDATITIKPTGVSPVELRVAVGTRVTFVNDDARSHAMSSDPLEVHTDCPAINDVGVLNPGQSRMTSALTTARTCGYHDHENENDAAFKGRIIVQ